MKIWKQKDPSTDQKAKQYKVEANRFGELPAFSDMPRERHKHDQAQHTADRALSRAENTDKRVAALDEYKESHMLVIAFAFNSSSLSGDARTQLDGLAGQTKDVNGYLIEVKGFASSDGDDNYNSLLSQRRAETVVRYLIETHQISLRRIITPHGYGELAPVAENSTFQGRQQNRRVEVRILVNKGLEAASLDSVRGNESASNF